MLLNSNPIYSVNFWEDPWLKPGLILKRQLTHSEMQQSGIHQEAKVRDTLYNLQNTRYSTSNPRIQQIWNMIRCHNAITDVTKRMVWGNKKSAYSIGDTYEYLMKNGDRPKWRWCKRTWGRDSSLRHDLMLWKVLNGAILTSARLASLGMSIDNRCKFCNIMPETVDHLYFECHLIHQIWKKVMAKFHRRNVSTDNLREWRRIYESINRNNDRGRTLNAVLKCFLTSVWRERNARLFDNANAKNDSSFKSWVLSEIRDCVGQLTYAIDPGIRVSLLYSL